MRKGRALGRWILVGALSGAAAVGWAADPPAAANAPAASHSPAPPHVPQRLDLSAPPLNHVLSARELRAMEADADASADESEVDVDAVHYHAPVPNGFLHALPWAVMHPTQAWRVFTPVTEE